MFPSGAIQVLRNAVRGGMVSDFPEKKAYGSTLLASDIFLTSFYLLKVYGQVVLYSFCNVMKIYARTTAPTQDISN